MNWRKLARTHLQPATIPESNSPDRYFSFIENCDHTAGLPDEEIHQHYTDLLGQGDALLYGRTTYQLMEFWRPFLDKPSEEKSMNDFAIAFDRIPKIVFSLTLKNVDWKGATLPKRELKDGFLELKQQTGKDIFVGSRSLIIQMLNLGLIDEFQLCIYPVVAESGLQLFENINDGILFRLTRTKNLSNGVVIHYYEPNSE